MTAAADHAWIRGFATALAEMHRRLLDGQDSSGVACIMRLAGVTLLDLSDAGVSDFDVKEIRKALASDG